MRAIVLDCAAVAVVIICVFSCYRNGFANSAVRLLGWLASLVVASVASRPLAGWIYDNILYRRVLLAVEEQAAAFATPNELAENLEALVDGLPAGLSSILRVDGMEVGAWIESLTAQADYRHLASVIVDSAIEPVLSTVLSIMVFFVLFTLMGIVVRIVASMMKLINKVPIVGQINAVLGAAVGVGEGLLFVYVLALALRLGILLSGDGLSFVSERDVWGSYLFSYFYSLGFPLKYLI